MMFGLFNRDRPSQVKLENVSKYVQSLQAFTFFCNNAIPKEQQSIMNRTYNKLTQQILAALKKFSPIQIIRPLKTLCLRIYQANQGISLIHTLFLKICFQQNFPREALPIIETKCFPKKMLTIQYSQYCRVAGLIYLSLQEYQKSFKYLNKCIKYEINNLKNFVLAVKKIILLSIIIDKKLSFQQVKNIFQQAKVTQSLQFSEMYQKGDNKKNNDYEFRQQEMIPYGKLINGQTLIPSQQQQINQDKNQQLYQKILSSQQFTIRYYLKTNLIDINAKLRMNEIKEIPLYTWQNIKKINGQGIQKIYKYDSMKKQVSFDQFHNNVNQDKINNKVSQCMNEYLEVVSQIKANSEKKTYQEKNRPGLSSFLDRLERM